MTLTSEVRNGVVASLIETPGAVLEQIAEQHDVSTKDVVDCLPDGEALTIDGKHFETVMLEISNWGEITFLVNTKDLILEAKGVVPKGSMGRGFYNLHGKPIGGHLNAGNCASISFISRKLFSSDTHSVQFYNHDGGCMFKIYLGRDADRNLIPEQVLKYQTYRDSDVFKEGAQ